MELMRYKLEGIADFNKTSIAQNEHSVIDYLDTGSITENVISEVSTLKRHYKIFCVNGKYGIQV